MDPRAQDILLCDLCGTDPLLYFCEQCDINLCTNCIAKHSFDSSKQHNILSYHLHRKFAPQYAKCKEHADKDCVYFCENCEIPVCSICITSHTHKGHHISNVLEKLKRHLQKDLEELEKRIYPRYEEMASDIQAEKSILETNYSKLTTAVDQQGEALHNKVTAIVNQRKSDITEAKNKHLAALKSHTDEITQRVSEIEQVISEIKNILYTNDIFLTSTYISRNEEFNKLPSKIKVTIPSLSTPTINTENIDEMIGILSSLSITTVRLMLDEPRFTATIDTGYEYLYSVKCVREDEVWTRGDSNIMKLLNHQGELLSSIRTKSENTPGDITVTHDGDLVYTDRYNKTVNHVKNNKIHTMITLQKWKPRNVCTTASNDLLVTMISDDDKESKVVRYSGSTKTQTIQFDDQGRPLYSPGYTQCISENRNLDICVADRAAKAVVVVNQSGKLRFRYTGNPSNTKKTFDPVGITTDSQSRILIAECFNDRIHILDQDGQFLRYIHDLRAPFGLCVDSRENMFVAEYDTGKVKKIKYL